MIYRRKDPNIGIHLETSRIVQHPTINYTWNAIGLALLKWLSIVVVQRELGWTSRNFEVLTIRWTRVRQPKQTVGIPSIYSYPKLCTFWLNCGYLDEIAVVCYCYCIWNTISCNVSNFSRNFYFRRRVHNRVMLNGPYFLFLLHFMYH